MRGLALSLFSIFIRGRGSRGLPAGFHPATATSRLTVKSPTGKHKLPSGWKEVSYRLGDERVIEIGPRLSELWNSVAPSFASHAELP